MKHNTLKVVLAASNKDKTKLHKLLKIFTELPIELQQVASSAIREQLQVKDGIAEYKNKVV